MAFLPLAFTAASALYQGYRAKQADEFNASVMANERASSINQAAAQEGQVRRASREALGRQLAAFGGAGVGYGGSSATALSEAAVNQELDALNTRYKGAFTGYGYGVESQLLKKQAGEEMTSSILLAGSRALQGASGSYSLYRGTPGMAEG